MFNVYKVILHLSSEVWEWLFIVVNDIRLPIQLLCGGVVDFQEDAFTICRRGFLLNYKRADSILLFHHVIVSIALGLHRFLFYDAGKRCTVVNCCLVAAVVKLSLLLLLLFSV